MPGRGRGSGDGFPPPPHLPGHLSATAERKLEQVERRVGERLDEVTRRLDDQALTMARLEAKLDRLLMLQEDTLVALGAFKPGRHSAP